MLEVVIPALILLIGAALYGFSSNQRVQNIGLVMFACGMFVCTQLLSGSHFSIARR